MAMWAHSPGRSGRVCRHSQPRTSAVLREGGSRGAPLTQLAEEHGKQVATHLYGQEINAETYAICKADLLLKGEGEAADNIIGGPEYSTLSNDAFRAREFDFMLSNPPYGKSWKSDQQRMGGKSGIKDPRFVIEHADDPEYSLVTRSSDGQMLFLANMCSKMNHDSLWAPKRATPAVPVSFHCVWPTLFRPVSRGPTPVRQSRGTLDRSS